MTMGMNHECVQVYPRIHWSILSQRVYQLVMHLIHTCATMKTAWLCLAVCWWIYKHNIFLLLNKEQSKTFDFNGRVVFIRFQAHQSSHGLRFLMNYIAVPKPGACELLTAMVLTCGTLFWLLPPFVDQRCPPALPPTNGCDGGVKVIRRESGILTSPYYPTFYAGDLQCRYAIDVSGNSTIETILVGSSHAVADDCVFGRVW